MAVNEDDFAIFKVNSISIKNGLKEFSVTLLVGSVFDYLSIDDDIDQRIPIMTSLLYP